jgi:hypothetical protein
MPHLYYYKLEEAEKIKSTYESWIGKEAHVGKGVKETLQSINIKERQTFIREYKTETFFKVEFEFETKKRFSAHEFLIHNNLIPIYHIHP